MKVEYIPVQLDTKLNIDNIVSLHYYEYNKNFDYSGEMHDFWEFIYCDKTYFEITAGTQEMVLEAGHAYLHPPGQFHKVKTDGIHAANSFIFSFHSSCPELYRIADRILTIDNYGRETIANILKEATGSFTNELGKLVDSTLVRRDTERDYAGEQVICANIQLLLISLIRQATNADAPMSPAYNYTRGSEKMLNIIVDYLETHPYEKMSFHDISKKFLVGETTLKSIFSKNVGCGVIDYFLKCRLNESKKLIREGNMNISQIADKLNFTSVHHFSKTFKKKFGVTPTEYAKSILIIMDEQNDK